MRLRRVSTQFALYLCKRAFVLASSSSFEVDPRLVKEIQSNPISKNPFLPKLMGSSFDAPEQIDDEISTGFCRWIGPLNCDEGVEIECLGVGLVDCADECPGTESQLDELIDMMENITSNANEYPVIAAHFNRSKNAPNAGEKRKEMMKEIAQTCGFQTYLDIFCKSSA